MTIYICGAGPTGLSLAWLLGAKKNKKIVIIEKYKAGGGTWATKWVSGPYGKLFTHHSPQILTTSYVNTFKLWREMGINYKDFTTPYYPKWIGVVYAMTNIWDKILLVLTGVCYIFNKQKYGKITVVEQFKNVLSDKGWNMLNQLCYLVDGVSANVMTVGELYGLVNQTFLYSSLEMSVASDNDKGFAKQWVDKLKEHDVSFMFNSELSHISENGLYVNRELIPIDSNDSVLLALDPLSLYKVLSKSDTSIKNNWGKWCDLENHILKGVYVSISVQYHLEYDIFIPYKTRIGVNTEWGIICVMSPFLSVMSCSVINQESYSSILNKKVRDCNPKEIKEEVWRQLSSVIPELTGFKSVTMGEDVKWDGYKWDFGISSACKTVDGYLESGGKKDNLFILGPLNKRNYPATTMEAAVETAIRFVDIKYLERPYMGTDVLLGLSVVLVCLIILVFLFAYTKNNIF